MGGGLDSSIFIPHVNKAYDEVVHWKMNLFPVPFGSVGKSFVSELARLYRAFETASALEGIALKAVTVLIVLALQRPYSRSKGKIHTKCLQRRMDSWSKGLVDELLAEGKTIQTRAFRKSCKPCGSRKSTPISRSFAKLMFQGECNASFRLLDQEQSSTGVLNENDTLPSGETVSDALREKYPDAQGPNQEALYLHLKIRPLAPTQ